MYSILKILKKQRAAAVIVLALDIFLILDKAEGHRIINFSLGCILAFILWTELLIIQAQEEEAKKVIWIRREEGN
jgi:hypothetical protein